MAKDKIDELEQLQPRSFDAPLGFESNMSLRPILLSEIIDEVMPTGIKMSAEELSGETFSIIRAKPFPSRFEEQDHAYYVVGITDPGGDLFNTVLGGAAVVDLLDQWSMYKRTDPLKVKLVFTKAGRYGGYYTLE